MNEIPKKNYYFVVVLIVVTVFMSLSLVRIYNNKEKFTSNFYKYANKITYQEFQEYISERTDMIIYFSDKYDLSHESFEKKFISKIDDLNLKNNLIYIDKMDLNKEFLKELEDNYKIIIDKHKLPIIVVMSEGKVRKTVYIEKSTNVDTIIDYEVFE